MTVETPDDRLLTEVEEVAVSAASGAGEILTRYFGRLTEVELQGRAQDRPRDAGRHRDRGVRGQRRPRALPRTRRARERRERATSDSPAPDFVWAIDPLDGTNDFVGGLPIFASSIGVLHRGVPVAGAVYVPWPGAATGRVFHARRGGGAFVDDDRLTPLTAEAGDGRLASMGFSLRGGFGGFKVRKGMRAEIGEVRTLGSIAYELAMVAAGVLRYTFVRRTSLWDCAAGAAILAEAGADVRVGRWVPRTWPLAPGLRLERAATLVDWTPETTLAGLRRWSAPLIVGRPDIVPGLAAAITPRRRLRLRRR